MFKLFKIEISNEARRIILGIFAVYCVLALMSLGLEVYSELIKSDSSCSLNGVSPDGSPCPDTRNDMEVIKAMLWATTIIIGFICMYSHRNQQTQFVFYTLFTAIVSSPPLQSLAGYFV